MRHQRHHLYAPAFSLALLLGACGTQPEQTSALPDDLKHDLAVASTSGGDLAIAPRLYQRMRFVSPSEQLESAAPARRPATAAAHHAARRAPIHRAAPSHSVASVEQTNETATEVAEAPVPARAAPSAPEPAAGTERASPASSSAGESGRGPSEGASDRGRGGGGLGGILGGIIGAVVIRGGMGGVDHCDPRTDGRAGRPTTADRPTYGLPSPGQVMGRMGGGVRF